MVYGKKVVPAPSEDVKLLFGNPGSVGEHHRCDLPHLAKHVPFTAEDLPDILASDPLFFPADPTGDADWLMVGEVPGPEIPVVVPLANSGNPATCRPVGIYEATGALLENYLEERGR